MSLITKNGIGRVRTVKARKAQAFISAVPSLVIVIDREMPVARDEARNRSRQNEDARKLVEALEVSLPAGTLASMAEILVDKANRPGVSHRSSSEKLK